MAQSMLETDKYLCNTRIFLFRAKDMVAAFYAHVPDLLVPVQTL